MRWSIPTSNAEKKSSKTYSGMKMIQHDNSQVKHPLANYGTNFLARFVFEFDRNFLEGKLIAGKITIRRLRTQLKLLARFATCFDQILYESLLSKRVP